MSKAPSKHGRDQAMGFLNDLQDWELSLKDKKSRPQDSAKGKSKLGLVSEEKQSASGNASYSTNGRRSMQYDPLSNVPSSFMAEEGTVDATSEKDLGNEYFKQRKFNEAIDCYSRSIALSPTAVAYANRAMAYLKIRRFKEAEDDCTEALNLDDRYIKAYSRRATARKELGKLRDAFEDVEFALRLEPQNEELKKQRSEIKSLLEKAILARAGGTAKKPVPVVKEVMKNVDANRHERSTQSIAYISEKPVVDVLPDDTTVSGRKLPDSNNTENKTSDGQNRLQSNDSHEATISHLKNNESKKELGTSVQELASRAASRALAEAAKNITPPNSAYQFEATWRGFSGDRSLQAHLLKVTAPEALPQIFKNALTAPLLLDIIKCISTIFTADTELAVKYLENLTKVSRFDMIIMCLARADKADLCRIWNEEFLGKATPIEYAEKLSELRPRYCPQ